MADSSKSVSQHESLFLSINKDLETEESPPSVVFDSIVYGQLVIGPPGSGKTTYCDTVGKHLKEKYGDSNVAIVNMDPGNDLLPYVAQANVQELVTVDQVMDTLGLGPNGAYIFSMEFIEAHLSAVTFKLHEFFSKSDASKPRWILFDMPGQVELYVHARTVKETIKKLESVNIRLVAVNLVDSHHCTDPGKFIATVLSTLTMMINLALPHINILSKIDLMKKFKKLPFRTDFYTDVLDLEYLVEHLGDDEETKNYRGLNEAIISVIENYGLVSFVPMCIKDQKIVENVMIMANRCVGILS